MTPFEIISAAVNSQRVADEIISALADNGFEIVETQDREAAWRVHVSPLLEFRAACDVNEIISAAARL